MSLDKDIKPAVRLRATPNPAEYTSVVAQEMSVLGARHRRAIAESTFVGGADFTSFGSTSRSMPQVMKVALDILSGRSFAGDEPATVTSAKLDDSTIIEQPTSGLYTANIKKGGTEIA